MIYKPFNFSSSIFYNRTESSLDGYQIEFYDDNNNLRRVNAFRNGSENVYAWGWETALDMMWKGLDLFVSYSYAEAWKDPAESYEGYQVENAHVVADVPTHRVSSGWHYAIPVYSNQFHLSSSFHWINSYRTPTIVKYQDANGAWQDYVNPKEDVEGYLDIKANIDFELSHGIQFGVGVDNLLDQKICMPFNENFGVYQDCHTPLAGREWQINFKGEF